MMDSDLIKKYSFFKKNEKQEHLELLIFKKPQHFILGAGLSLIVLSSLFAGNATKPPEIEIKKSELQAQDLFEQQIQLYKYFSNTKIHTSHEEIKQDLKEYNIEFDKFEPMKGIVKYNNLTMDFTITEDDKSMYFYFLPLKDANRLIHKINDSSQYDINSVIHETSVSVLVKSKMKLHLPPSISQFEPLTPQEIRQIKEIPKVRDELSTSEDKEIAKLNKKLEIAKLKNLIAKEEAKNP